MIDAKRLFDQIRAIKGSPLTQAEVDTVNAILAPVQAPPLSPPIPWLARAKQELGVHETPGAVTTPRIELYRSMAGLSGIKGDDGAVPWCAIFVGAMLRQVGLQASGSAMARSYSNWGERCPDGTPGAITVKSSTRGPTSGHVFFATGNVTTTHIEGLGGNQSDAVTLAWWPRAEIVTSRWPSGVPMPAAGANMVSAIQPPKKVTDV